MDWFVGLVLPVVEEIGVRFFVLGGTASLVERRGSRRLSSSHTDSLSPMAFHTRVFVC